MNPALSSMLDTYRPQNPVDYQNAAREIVQELALLGLWRSGFFNHAAFYGGTALRIFHGLRRFSEDLDFTLLSPNPEIRLERYLPSLAGELAAWGFSFDVESRSSGERTGIQSAFLKGNTQINLLHVGAPPELTRRLPSGQRLKIKLEMDSQPPPHATTEVRTQIVPTPYQVMLYDLSSLFAGKLHAVLCRGWKTRIKGRDFYDFVWYVGREIAPNLQHLEARMRQSGHWSGEQITLQVLTELLAKRFETINFNEAANEVRVFLHDAREVELWSRDFFMDMASRIVAPQK
jgi:predicted nucleotidyltransferase component of viral defense system